MADPDWRIFTPPQSQVKIASLEKLGDVNGLPPELSSDISMKESAAGSGFEYLDLRIATCLPDGVLLSIWFFPSLQNSTPQLPIDSRTNIQVLRGKLVGQGAFSDVYECFCHPSLPLHFATQHTSSSSLHNLEHLHTDLVMKVHRFNAHRFQTKESKFKCIEHEAYSLCLARHPNVMPLVGIAQASPDDTPSLIFPKVPYNLLSYIDTHPDISPFSLAIPIAEAMAHVHKCGITHRDVKPGNILVDAYGVPYLADFGSCRIDKSDHPWKEALEEPSDGACTVDYAAPEILLNRPSTQASDVYSFAIVTNQIFGGGASPYPKWMRPGAVVLAVCDRKERPVYAVQADPAIRRIISKCWAENPSDRPTMHEVLEELKELRDVSTYRSTPQPEMTN